MSLVQSDMSIVKYEEIYQIAKYVIAIVIDEADKCKWF